MHLLLFTIAIFGIPFAGYSFKISPQHQNLGIIGGKEVNITDYPYQVSVQYFDEHYCGGAIINEKFVITAAHCTNKKTIYSINVRVGTSLRDQGGEVLYLKAIYQHPKFNDFYDYDISLLELEESLIFGPTIQPVVLAEINEKIPSKSLAVVTGWGTTEAHNSTFSEKLQETEVPVLSFEECVAAYGPDITNRMLCAGYPNGSKDACHGDSGGPLVLKDVLVGIISWGRGCGKANYPGVYASVSVLRSYIHEITRL